MLARVMQVHVPAKWIGRQYSEFWQYMLRHKSMLLLGLHRPVLEQNCSFYTVLTNPDKVCVTIHKGPSSPFQT